MRFLVGSNTVECVHLPILNDVCVEDETEVFSVSISSEIDCVLVEPSASSFQVTIMDEDGRSTQQLLLLTNLMVRIQMS